MPWINLTLPAPFHAPADKPHRRLNRLLLPLLFGAEPIGGNYYREIAFPQVLDKQKTFQHSQYFTLVTIFKDSFRNNSLGAGPPGSDLETLGHPSRVVMIPDFKTREFE